MTTKAPVNKAEIIDLMAESADISKAAATKAFNALIDGIKASLSKGHEVRFADFGSFVVRARKSRDGRNPKTGEKIVIPASLVIALKASKALKDAVNLQPVEVD